VPQPKFFIALAFSVLLAACGASGQEKGRDRPPPLVKVEAATTMRFVDRVEAVGSAVANEQVTLSSPVTERITRLNFDDGSFVRAGQVVAVLQQSQEAAQLAEVQARARQAEQQLGRITQLKNRGFATRADYDVQVAAAAAARAQGQQVRAQIGERVITAPFSGWVSLRNISAGAVVNQGTPIATISDVSTIKLDFPVPETMLSVIRPGQTIEAVSAAWPGAPFRGTIHTIDPVVDPATRAVTVRARLPNPDRRLRPGMMLTVGIETAPRLSLSVPELAIVGEGERRFVFVLGEGNRARRTEVRTGIRSGGRVEILEGLSPGQRVITEGVVKVADGMAVRVGGADNARGRANRGGGGGQPQAQGGQAPQAAQPPRRGQGR
jgi:membrane fusion protein (multidrug efflux system)